LIRTLSSVPTFRAGFGQIEAQQRNAPRPNLSPLAVRLREEVAALLRGG
jgi:hypothetical protein